MVYIYVAGNSGAGYSKAIQYYVCTCTNTTI